MPVETIGAYALLPSFKLARLVAILPDGRKVFVDDAGKRLCEHGERSSTISTWLLNEKQAQRDGVPPTLRTSSCTCQTTEGLNGENLPLPNASEPAPRSVFEHLQSRDTHCLFFKGREGRQIPFTRGAQTAYVTFDGRIVCKHGRARLTLQGDAKAIRKGGGVHPGHVCGCKAFPIPKRMGHHTIKLGMCGDRMLTKFQRTNGNAA